MGAGDRVRVGVLGCASIAERRMLPSMGRQPLVEIAAIASRDPARAASFAARFGGEPVTGYDALLARPDVDAVYLPLPPGLHVEWTLRALRAGKHVLCEKPFATSLAEAETPVRVAGEHGLLLMESFMFLYHAQHAAVARLVAGGAIGELRGFASDFGIPALPAGDGCPVRHASTLAEVAAYPIRAAQLFLGDGLAVVGGYRCADGRFGPQPSGAALLVSPAGVTAQLRYGLDHGYRSGYALWGSAGYLSLHRAFSTPDEHVPVIRLDRGGTVEEIALEPDRQFVNVAGEFARAILHNGDFRPYGEAILRQARLVDAIDRRSGATR
jgi:dTDP-3,4-didehydro-2,6-dideoxy-alpha-D-glucose 3-reductase